MIVNQSVHIRKLASLSVSVELLKPITWFPPMWAFLCGAVSAGFIFIEHLPIVFVGILLAGPVICGMSQAINDWGDRIVDAINEPSRPIPSGRISSTWAFFLAILLIVVGIQSLSIGLIGELIVNANRKKNKKIKKIIQNK